MNLDSCTPGQRTIVTTLDKPLSVAAGAGSGKTFTLTQRIAHALTFVPEGASAPYLSSISEVLAITFTNKAAAELKDRIKGLLRSEGLIDQALAVDDAWISTIHGMCSRILREHALELGLDPAFVMVSDNDAAELSQQAVNNVLELVRVDPAYSGIKQLFSVRKIDEVLRWTRALQGKIQALPGGYDALYRPVITETPGSLVCQMLENALPMRDVIAAWGKTTKADERVAEEIEQAIPCAEGYLAHAPRAFDDESFDYEEFLKVFLTFPTVSEKYHEKKEDGGYFAGYREESGRIYREAEACAMSGQLEALVAFSQAIDAEYARLKGPAQLDNTDLLLLALRALEDHPEIAAAYREQFKLIMVDEFQDTDKLQVAIIGHLLREGSSNFCTVGDAQQSIYRFRGADVQVFFDVREEMERELKHATFVSLPDNFRSHADVLSLVDSIFARPEAFGDKFLRLEPKGPVNQIPDATFDDYPRISAAYFDAREKGVVEADAHQYAAQALAQHFVELRNRGVSAGDMTLLVRKLAGIEPYLEALRKEGFECVISGGSVFSQSVEAQLVASLLSMCASPRNSEALYTVLSSALFNLSDTALLCLASTQSAKSHRPCSLDLTERFQAFARAQAADGVESPLEDIYLNNPYLTQTDRAEITRTFGLLFSFRNEALNGSVAYALQHLFINAGWFYRMQEEGALGQAAVANFNKANGLVRDFEKDCFGVVSLASTYSTYLELSKQAPGALATESANFIRVMTIHASKGLEFPHVGLALLTTRRAKAESFTVDTYGEWIITSLHAPKLDANYDKKSKAMRSSYVRDSIDHWTLFDTLSSSEVDSLLEAYEVEQEENENQRLLYVALTRASKSIFVAGAFSGNKEGDLSKKCMIKDLYLGLPFEFTEGVQMINYGGTQPARVIYSLIQKPFESEGLQQQECSTFEVVELVHPVAKKTLSTATTREVFSYSSLGHTDDAGEVNDPDGMFDPFEASLDLCDEEPFFDMPLSVEVAVHLGSAFHLLAQQSIERRNNALLPKPSAADRQAQERQFSLSDGQKVRLASAIDRWFDSACAQEFAAHAHCYAEVPFFIPITIEGETRFLEGEIDGLATNDGKSAYLIDYKTGQSIHQNNQELHEKHLLQAQCYAYALMSEGYTEVNAHFVRVEVDDPNQSDQPQIVPYRFTVEDKDALEATIIQEYRKTFFE